MKKVFNTVRAVCIPFIIAIFSLLLISTITTSVKLPSICYINYDHTPLIEGETQSFKIMSSNCTNDIQYRVFLSSSNDKTTELTDGYSSSLKPNSFFDVSPSEPFKKGDYSLKVFVKRAGKPGVKFSSHAGLYDSCETFNFSCYSKDDSNYVYSSGKMQINTTSLKTGEPIMIGGVDNIGGMKGPYTYRLNAYKQGETPGDEGISYRNLCGSTYSTSILWTPMEPGTYILRLSIMSAGSPLWDRLDKHPTADIYDSYKTCMVTVTGDTIHPPVDEHTPLYNEMKAGLESFNETISIKANKTDTFASPTVFAQVLKDNPELCYHSNYSISPSDNGIVINIKYNYPPEEAKRMHTETTKKVQEICDSIIRPDMNDLEKEKAIHDYIVSNCEYYDFKDEDDLPQVAHTPYGCLINKKCVCDGYARAMYMLLKNVGINNMVVVGTADDVPHAWNLVNLHSRWYHVDCTFDDPVTYLGSIKIKTHSIKYTYFNLDDSDIEYDHSWNRSLYPAAQ